MFVGNTVSGEESDILEVVNFLADFLNSEAQIKIWLTDLIADKAQILDAKGNNIFSGRFTPLMGFGGRVDELYADILLRVFNASARQRLKLVNIKSSKGELALRVGDAEPFGLINIGDDAGFFGMAEDVEAFDSERDDFGGALFGTLNNKDSFMPYLCIPCSVSVTILLHLRHIIQGQASAPLLWVLLAHIFSFPRKCFVCGI